MGREGEGGGGGEYEGECLFDDNRDEDEYDNNKEYHKEEDGKGSKGGADDGGEPNYDGRDIVCGPSFGSVGQRMLINGPHAAAIVINNNNFNNNHRHGGGRHAPPPPVRPVPPDAACRRQCRRPWSMAATQGRLEGGRTRDGGGSSAPFYSFVRF
jgi:hypothetical protein